MSGRLIDRSAIYEHPARTVALAFVVAIAIGTALLLLPFSTQEGTSTDPLTALFTASSAICVTGLAVVDTGTYWSGFGQLVLLVLVQLGGLGLMTIASIIAMVVSRRLGLRMALIASRERSTLNLGDVRRVLQGVALVTLGIEATAAVVLALRLRFAYDYAWSDAAWHGLFHSITAFNNAGFSLYADSLTRFATDVVVIGVISVAIVVGGLGFPVLVDLYEHRRERRWPLLTLHSRMTIVATACLLVAGVVWVGVAEWTNPATLGRAGVLDKGVLAGFASVSPRTAGFNAIDVGAMTDVGLLGTMVLMFIGAGSAGTSGGIKVGTFSVLALLVWSQLRGTEDVTVFRRRISGLVQREATTVILLGFASVVAAVVVLLGTSPFPLRDAAFEAISAFGTVGLSTGITPMLGGVSQLVLIAIMLIGRVGPVTLGMALVLKRRDARIRYPEEAPLIG
ncbi:MAG: TrkH family potassium uptake protein [Acidimicrobiales bacterium]|nr:TrkH family potassium uptake protein [Acidimicrobiales bacterium]